jgi:hypothetical protein
MGYQSALEQLRNKYLTILKEPNSKPKWNVLRSVLISPSEQSDVWLAQLAQNWLEQNGPPPHIRRPPRGFAGEHPRADRVPPFESQYICGLAFLRAGRDLEALRWLRLAAAPQWPAQGLVDAPLAIALEQLGKSSEAIALISHSTQQIQDWMDHAMDIDSLSHKLPWYCLAEAIAMHRDASHQLHGEWIDSPSQIAALRSAAIRKLDSTAR